MKLKLLPVILLLVLALAVPVFAQDEAGDLMGRINNLRASKGLPAYTFNGALASAAQSQSQWLIDNGCAIAHVHPDGSSPRSRSLAAGYTTSEVSENIYCGGMATVNDAWTFWVNSGIHYAGLVNTRYKEIGIGIAHNSNGSGFTLVFGNPGGPEFVPPAAAAGGNSSQASAAQGPPSFVVGQDAHGNIMHQIQEGDTLGDILLIYGYTWADIPRILDLNQMTQDDFRKLEVGAIILVPPQAGTFTPTPGGNDAATATPEAPAESPTEIPTELPSDPTPEIATQADPEPTEIAFLPTVTTFSGAATANSVPQVVMDMLPTNETTALPELSPTPVEVAMAATGAPSVKSAGIITRPSSTSPALIIALVVQVAVLLGAGYEFIRRMRRR